MLKITIPAQEYYDETKNEFIYLKERELCLEHSLVSVARWESKWNKPFLSKDDKTNEEMSDYIRCMNLDQSIDPLYFKFLPKEDIIKINDYINAPMTATTFSDKTNKPSREIITAEIIYYWMIALQIPFECQKWHLNRLLTLVKVCDIKNSPNGKKMSYNEQLSRNKALNEARRKRLHSRG